MIRFQPIDANDQLIEAELDGALYHVSLSWNQEASRWTMAVLDLDKRLIVSGIAMVPLWPLLRQVRGPEIPAGEFVVDAPKGWIGRDSFVQRDATLFYVEEAEVPS